MGSLHPFLDRNGAKTIPYRAAHAFMAYIWNKPPLPRPHCRKQPLESYSPATSRVVSTPMGMTKLECPLQVVGCLLVDGRLNTPEGSFSLVSVYPPILPATPDVEDEFYENLATTILTIPSSERLVILGDFNARVGADNDSWPSCLGPFGVRKMN